MGGDTTTAAVGTSPSGQGHGQGQQQQQQQQTQQRDPQKKPPLSCTSCRTRKLKCDKQDPCHNCLRIGSECVFPARKRIQRPRKTKNTELLRRLNRLESIVGKVGLADLDEAADALDDVVMKKATVDAVSGSQQQQQQQQHQHQHQLHPALAAQPDSRDHGLNSVKGVARIPHDPTASRYLSGEFWSSLCDEVGGLRQALEQTTDSDEEDTSGDDEVVSPESVVGGGRMMSIAATSPGMLLGSLSTNDVRTIAHPRPDHIRYLASAFFRNVDMHLKILHRPTILNALYNLADYPETAADLGAEREALFFAIYYAAVTSIDPLECTHNLGRPRADLSSLFQAGFEQALVRADYLNNTSLETLQALTLYTCCLRSHNGSRASWALLGLPIRLAQALNIHQDGDGSATSRLSPYEAEMRRRLWWQLIVLDIRAAEDRGTNTIIARGSYNTRLPHNIDDAEFGPDTKTPLEDRPGPSDVTFSLCAAQSSGLFLYFEHAQGAGPVQSEEDTVRQAQHLESLFVKGADPGHVGSYLASVTVRLIILKMWLVMRYPLHPRGGGRFGMLGTAGKKMIPATQPPASASEFLASRAAAASESGAQLIQDPSISSTSCSSVHPISNHSSSIPTSIHHQQQPGVTPTAPAAAAAAAAAVSSESTLRTALSIIELHEFMQTGPYSDRFRWWTNTYVQWHPLAVALAELCTRTRGETADRAWRIIDDVFPRWSRTIADTKRGSLWRPLRKLYKRAKAAREAALDGKSKSAFRENLKQQQQQQVPLTTTTQQQTSWGPLAISNTNTNVNINVPESEFVGAEEDTVMQDIGLGRIQPRLITDMVISESAANSQPRDLPPAHTHTRHRAMDPIGGETESIFASTAEEGGNNDPNPDPDPDANLSMNFNLNINFDPMAGIGNGNGNGDSLAQSWFAWPDLNFDVMGSHAHTHTHDNHTPTAPVPIAVPVPLPVSGSTGTGTGNMDPTLLLDNTNNTNNNTSSNSGIMDWTTWDEFVLDTYTYAADSTPKSGSGASEV